jgi:hypothetical protein
MVDSRRVTVALLALNGLRVSDATSADIDTLGTERGRPAHQSRVKLDTNVQNLATKRVVLAQVGPEFPAARRPRSWPGLGGSRR